MLTTSISLVGLIHFYIKKLLTIIQTEINYMKALQNLPSRGTANLTRRDGLRASMILKAMPTRASAPDMSTHAGKAEGERSDESSYQDVWMLRWQPHHRNWMLKADKLLILNYYQRN
jgi:hypothetical protein